MPALTVEVIGCDDPKWDERLKSVVADVYQTAGYHRYAQEADASQAFLLDVSDSASGKGLVWPYLLRKISDTPGLEGAHGWDVTSVYGYPGPLVWGCRPGDPFLRDASDAVVDSWQEQGAISAFTRFNPVLDNARWGADLPVGGPDGDEPLQLLGDTVGIDLRVEDSSSVAGYKKKLRQDIGRARRAGMSTFHDDEWAHLEAFAELYGATMARNEAATSYSLSIDQIRSLRSELGPDLHLFVGEMGGETAIAGLFTEHGGIVQAHLVGANEDYMMWSPLKVLLDDVRQWAHDRGDHVLHLGGGRGGQGDSLFAFKSRFSPIRFEFWVGRWVLDPEAYAALRPAHEEQGSQVPPGGGYFPAYRAPKHLPPPRNHRRNV